MKGKKQVRDRKHFINKYYKILVHGVIYTRKYYSIKKKQVFMKQFVFLFISIQSPIPLSEMQKVISL